MVQNKDPEMNSETRVLIQIETRIQKRPSLKRSGNILAGDH